MSSPNPRNVIKLRGRLVAAPTDLTSPYPHGGTELGLVNNGRFVLGMRQKVITAEEFGQQTVEVLQAGTGNAVLLAVLRSFDNDLLPRIFPSTVAGASSGDQVIQSDASAGGVGTAPQSDFLGADRGFVLFYSPDDVDLNPSILLYNAIPALQESAEIQINLASEMSFAVAFHAAHDASFRNYRIGKREDLTL